MTKASLKGKIPTNDLTQVKPNAIESSVTKKKKKPQKNSSQLASANTDTHTHTKTANMETNKLLSYRQKIRGHVVS